jgi:hypothetical protein
VHAEDGDSAEASRVSGAGREDAAGGPEAAPRPDPNAGLDTEPGTAEPGTLAGLLEAQDAPPADPAHDPQLEPSAEGPSPEPAPAAETPAERARRGLPLTNGIGCAALLLPLVAVAGAILCFAAGILSTASGCSTHGSALCSSNGPLVAFALPVFVSPLVAAGTAIGAVTVRRHRSTWLAVGYGIVFISIIVGLASASTGS